MMITLDEEDDMLLKFKETTTVQCQNATKDMDQKDL